MSTREILMRAVCDFPADDGPRLALADWLDQNDEPQYAEYIRLCCALARLPEGTEGEPADRERAFALWQALSASLFEPLPRLRGIEWRGFGTGSRGFAEEIVVTGVKGFLANADEAFRAAPVERLQFRKVTPADLRTILALPWMKQIACLNLNGRREVGDEGARAITEAINLGALRELHLSGTNLTPTGLGLLADWPGLDRLVVLDISKNRALHGAGQEEMARVQRRCEGRCKVHV